MGEKKSCYEVTKIIKEDVLNYIIEMLTYPSSFLFLTSRLPAFEFFKINSFMLEKVSRIKANTKPNKRVSFKL